MFYVSNFIIKNCVSLVNNFVITLIYFFKLVRLIEQFINKNITFYSNELEVMI